MKLLRVPKIYNALITTNQKLLPSEAFPATSGPSFQPIGLSGDPVLLNPQDFEKQEEAMPLEGDAPRPFAKMPTPITFYPRYNVYHQLPQSVFPYHDVYQPPPIVVPVQRSQSPQVPKTETPTEEAPQQENAPKPEFGFVTNNRPDNSDIPNVPPPLPPVGAPRPQEESSPEVTN